MGLLLSRLADRCLGFDSFMSLTCGANSVVNGPKLALKSLLISPRQEQRIIAKLRLKGRNQNCLEFGCRQLKLTNVNKTRRVSATQLGLLSVSVVN